MSGTAKRAYKKRSDYWQSIAKADKPIEEIRNFGKTDSYEPELMGESFYEAVASTSSTQTAGRTNKIHKNPAKDRFKNINDGLLPFHYSADSVDVKDAIELSQKAYFNVPVCRSTVDLMSEFADSAIYLDGGSAASKKFINAWFKRIKLHDLKEQYFREYYRSGNVFLYRLEGKYKSENSKKILESYAKTVSAKVGLPIKYLLLNPTDISSKATLSFSDNEYAKVLTPYEISRLKKPTNDHEKAMLAALPEDLQKNLQTKGVGVGSVFHFPLKHSHLHAVFYKKQDYEPFAIPMIFPVLDDVNKKLELKKIDQAICRTIENVILLVTMGAKPEEGGINHANITAMQNIFKNQSVGRVLVADYTTKADFVIPDLRKVIGKEKYEILNRDISDGLQNVLLGESKYADTQLKLKIFMQRLDKAREIFLRDFLQPEIKRICLSMGMKNFPEAKFVKTDTLDSSDLQKLVIRMMELGILTPEEGLKTINTGIFPTGEDSEEPQKKFLQKRKDGFYMPLVNSYQLHTEDMIDEETPTSPAKPQNSRTKKAASLSGPSGGRPIGTSNAEQYSAKKIGEVVKAMNEFELRAHREFALHFGTDALSDSQKDIVSQVCETIIGSAEMSDWDNKVKLAVKDFTSLAGQTTVEPILKIGEKHQLDDLAASILYHSTKIG